MSFNNLRDIKSAFLDMICMNFHGKEKRIIVFGRYPFPGKVKTRLIPHLGPAGAADLQRELTELTINTSKMTSCFGIETEFCCDGGSKGKAGKWLGDDILFSMQEEGNLGKRMHTAFEKAFHDGCKHVVLIGADIPGMTTSHLKEAFDMLLKNDVVIGPSTDGGYWLVGMNRPLDIFGEIAWGSQIVLDQTLKKIRKKHLTYHLLEHITDIDTIADLKKWNPLLTQGWPYLSVIIPAINEERNIQKTIVAANNKDTEIIVVDGGSTDRTRTVAEKAGATVLTTEKGRALQQNAGAASAKGKVLLFLHADTLLPEHYVNHVFEMLMPKKTAAGAFRFMTDCRMPFMNIIEWMTNVRSWLFQLPYGDQALFMKKDLFHTVGGFPNVAIAEDLFLVRTLKRYGRIRTAHAYAVTSGRRWQQIGITKTTLINLTVMVGCYLGISPETMAPLYRTSQKKTKEPIKEMANQANVVNAKSRSADS